MGCLRLDISQNQRSLLKVVHGKGESTQKGVQRFISVDPMADQFASHSPYNYVFNNPIKFNDPTGMAPEDGDWPPNEGAKGDFHIDQDGVFHHNGNGWKNLVDGSYVMSEVTVTAKSTGPAKDIASNSVNAIGGAGTGLLPYADKGLIIGQAMDADLSGKLTQGKANSLGNLHNLSKYSKGLSKVGTAGTVLVGGADILTNISMEGEFGTYSQQATGRVAGSVAGAYYGAQAGAAVGILFGGAGAIPGGIIGGLIGGLTGSFIGEKGVQRAQKAINP